jgi:GT2 family glycosyltransferase
LQLSVIIVNFNVQHFLEQCLCSLRVALKGIEAEIIVVDNASDDGSLNYLKPLFPEVNFIANPINTGFARACNQGWRMSSGQQVLFLNPDTLVTETAIKNAVNFLNNTPDAGALGIRMLDGSGRFLKESKRSFPSPLISLYKLTGLARVFPRSKIFAAYHLGHLPEQANHQVDVLAGAFMLVRRKLLEATGGFDELFFMYGEDVDLSYRLQQQPCSDTGGQYRNYYYAGDSIIHFKGESTRKASMNYVRMFYTAMSLFVKKHYGAGRAGTFNFFIHLAIWGRAAISAIGRFVRAFGLPLIDASLILLSFALVKMVWANYVKPDVQYESRLLWIAFPAFTVVYLIAAYYAGLYDRWYRRAELIQSTLAATLLVLAVYALLPEQYRFSRGMILFGALLAFLLIGLLRRLLLASGVLSRHRQQHEPASTLVLATEEEYAEVRQLLKEAGLQQKLLGRVSINDNLNNSVAGISELSQLQKTITFRELVVVAGTLPLSTLVKTISDLPKGLRVKWHFSGSHSIVGSDSGESSGESFSAQNGFQLADPYRRRLKRLIDVSVALLGILTCPVQLFIVKQPLQFLANCFSVLLAKKTWLGYLGEAKGLPFVRKAVLGSNGVPVAQAYKMPAESMEMLDYWYARDYDPALEWKKIWQLYTKLGAGSAVSAHKTNT